MQHVPIRSVIAHVPAEFGGQISPVCAKCEVQVRQRILQAGYYAKSDHLRRMMERSRARAIANRWGWRSLVVRAGGSGYCASIAAQILWHGIGALSKDHTSIGGASYAGCLGQCFNQQQLSSECTEVFGPVTGVAIIVGLFCIWWNPRWHYKLDGREGRLTGLQKYYNIQVILLLLRLGSWIWLREPTTSGVSRLYQRAAHSVFRPRDHSRRVLPVQCCADRLHTTRQLASQSSSFVVRTTVHSTRNTCSGFLTIVITTRSQHFSAFPISDLASGPAPSYSAWRPPTPPDDDPNAMEWEPTSTLQVKHKRVQTKPATRPSPFYGMLPALPANQLLRPMSQLAPRPPGRLSASPQAFLIKHRLNARYGPQAQSRHLDWHNRNSSPKPIWEADTGLEGMFNSLFSLSKDPIEVREQSRSQPMQHQDGSGSALQDKGDNATASLPRIVVSAGICIVSLLMWIFMSYLSVSWPLIRLATISLTALIPVTDAILDISTPLANKRPGETIGFLAELCALLLFGFGRVYGGALDTEKCDLAVAGVLSVLCWQEFFLFASQAPQKGDEHIMVTVQLFATTRRSQPWRVFSRLEAQREKQPLAHDSHSQSTGDTSAFYLDSDPILLTRQQPMYRQLAH